MKFMINFAKCFEILTENPPFAWQEKLYLRFLENNIPNSCDIPTGLGKTSVIVIWLLALAEKLLENPQENKIPRRLVYVVDRRVIVDQATDEAQKILCKLKDFENAAGDLQKIFTALQNSSFFADRNKDDEETNVVALSTLRGEYADNREWCLDPSRPAIIVGTIDMIGSRLLFSAYGNVGKNHKSLQAGLLGQDSLIVVDEAHLSPSFVTLLSEIKSKISEAGTIKNFSLIELSATLTDKESDSLETSSQNNIFQVDESDEDLQNEKSIVYLRFNAKKTIVLREFSFAVDSKNKTNSLKNFRIAQVAAIVEQATKYAKDSGAILIYVKEVETVKSIANELENTLKSDKFGIEDANRRILTMTGGMRGKERDEITKDEVFQKFIPKINREKPDGVWYLIATSTAEVGVNLDGDHAVFDLNSFDSLTQRIGRVNRFGNGSAKIAVVFSPQQIEVSNNYFSVFKQLKDVEEQLEEFNDKLMPLIEITEAAKTESENARKNLAAAKQKVQDKNVPKKSKDEVAKKEFEKARNEKTEAERLLKELKEKHNLAKQNSDEISNEVKTLTKEQKKISDELKEICKDYVRPLALEESEIFTYRKLKENEIDGTVAASPLALKKMSGDKNCYPLVPICPPLDPARIDDWAMTSALGKDYARPQVAAWLRGVVDDETAETNLCWRADLKYAVSDKDAEEMIKVIQPTSREKARETTVRAREMMKIIANELEARKEDKDFYVINQNGEVELYKFSRFVTAKKKTPEANRILGELFDILVSATVVMPCEAGGLKKGLVINDAKDLFVETGKNKIIKAVDDVLGEEDWLRLVFDPSANGYSVKNLQSGTIFDEYADSSQSINQIIENIEKKTGKICVHQSRAASENEIDTNEESEDELNDKKPKPFVVYFVAKKSPDRFLRDDDLASISTGKVLLEIHSSDVEVFARRIAQKLHLSEELIDALAIAGRWHDAGKNRQWWQRAIGNKNFPGEILAKSGSNRAGKNFNKFNNHYRHEFGSLVEAEQNQEINDNKHRELILHLIAAHHGWARPHFPERAFKMEIQPEPRKLKTAKDAMKRFVKLQNEYGWWQLAYLEALLKAADALASRNPSETIK